MPDNKTTITREDFCRMPILAEGGSMTITHGPRTYKIKCRSVGGKYYLLKGDERNTLIERENIVDLFEHIALLEQVEATKVIEEELPEFSRSTRKHVMDTKLGRYEIHQEEAGHYTLKMTIFGGRSVDLMLEEKNLEDAKRYAVGHYKAHMSLTRKVLDKIVRLHKL